MKKRLAEIVTRKAEIRKLLESDEKDIELDDLDKELKSLDAEASEIERRGAMAASLAGAPAAPAVAAESPTLVATMGENRAAVEAAAAEKRGKDLKEGRTVTIAASNIVLPAHQATDIKPTFNQVSSLIDRVNVKTLVGGESFTQPYEAGTAEGDYKAEGLDYADADTTFGYAAIAKAKITAYSEDTEEVLKLPAADYDGAVQRGISKSLRMKGTKQILIGDGGANHLTGIFSAAATAIDAATDIDVAAIDEDTLDEIICSFGGDEDVEDGGVLILNKQDLKAFRMLRDADGKKIYEVKGNGNTGTIDGIPYLINSACKAVSLAATAAGEYCMAYGPLSNYTLAVFSAVDIQRSTDYKFKSGHIAHRGSVFMGGNVTAKNGFLRVKKG